MAHGLSRRSFLAALAAPYLVNAKPLFEELSAQSSGILWKHDNAMSPARHLPETLGPGCAFLDYDNDGWMDVYLVNSGPCDFYKPDRPVGNALYRNNRDGPFTDITARAGVTGGTFSPRCSPSARLSSRGSRIVSLPARPHRCSSRSWSRDADLPARRWLAEVTGDLPLPRWLFASLEHTALTRRP